MRTPLFALALAIAGPVAAQEWNTPGGGSWNDPLNWNPQSVPDGVGAVANFADDQNGGALTSTTTITFSAPITVGEINVNIGFAGPKFFMQAGTIIMDNGGGADVHFFLDGTDIGQIQTDFVLMGDLIADWSNGNEKIVGTISGDYGITMVGNTRFQLHGNNTYTGETVIETGRIGIIGNGGLGDTIAGTLVKTDAVLLCESNSSPTYSGEPVTLDSGGIMRGQSGNWAETITMVGTGLIGPWFDTSTFTISGQLVGDAVFIRDSAQSNHTNDPTIESVLIVSNPNNSYTGGTVIDSGILSISDDGNLGVGGTPVTFDQFGFSEGPAVLLTTADMTTPRQIIMLDHGWLRAADGTTGTYTGAISGDRALTIGGFVDFGSVALAQANTYTGGTTVTSGTLLASNTTGSATGTGDVLVEAPGILGGTGSIDGAVTVDTGGRIEPGASTGTLTVGSVSLDAAATTVIEIADDTDHDVLAAVGDATLDGQLGIVLVGGYEPQASDTFEIITASNVIGTFAGVTGPGTVDVIYQADRVIVTVDLGLPDCPADCSAPFDGTVDTIDFLTLLGQWGTDASCDVDGSGVVDTVDFLAMLGAWGPCVSLH